MEAPTDWELLEELLAPLDELPRHMVLYIIGKMAGAQPSPMKKPAPDAQALMAQADVGDKKSGPKVKPDPIVKRMLEQA